MILYHITKKKNINKISSNGIVPGRDGVWLVGKNDLQSMLNMLYPSSYDLFIIEIDIPKDWIFSICRSLYGKYAVTGKKIFLKEYRIKNKIPVENIVNISEHIF